MQVLPREVVVNQDTVNFWLESLILLGLMAIFATYPIQRWLEGTDCTAKALTIWKRQTLRCTETGKRFKHQTTVTGFRKRLVALIVNF